MIESCENIGLEKHFNLMSSIEKESMTAFQRSYFEGKVSLSIHPANLGADGKSIGHILINTDDPQKRSIDGSYPIQISLNRAKIITRRTSIDPSFRNGKKSNRIAFMTAQNELRLNFIPEKNAYESDMWLSTPWGDIRERIKYTTGVKHSLYETFECMIYAFIIAIVVRTFFFGAFFIPSQSMEKTFYIGDRFVANKLVYFVRNPHRQEVVIFRTYAPKERMGRFHLEDSPHFDPTRNLREPEYYKSANQLIHSIVDPSFRERIEIRNGGLYADKLFLGFPEALNEKDEIFIDGKFFAKGRIESGKISFQDQIIGTVYIDGNHLVIQTGENRVELGKIDVYYPLGHSGLIQYQGRIPTNPLVDGIKSMFFTLAGRKPALIVGENQLIGNIQFKNDRWNIFGRDLDLNLNGRPMRFTLPYQGMDGEKVQLGDLCIEKGQCVLKDGAKTLKNFGQTILRDDVAIINEQLFGYVERSKNGFLINGLPLTDLWEIRDFIKRCIALPGDEIRIDDGKVFVNGDQMIEPYIDEENMRYDDFGPEVIPEGHYFMMGDNRNNSKDSRIIGPIPRQNIVGKAMFVFWPPNRVKSVSF